MPSSLRVEELKSCDSRGIVKKMKYEKSINIFALRNFSMTFKHTGQDTR